MFQLHHHIRHVVQKNQFRVLQFLLGDGFLGSCLLGAYDFPLKIGESLVFTGIFLSDHNLFMGRQVAIREIHGFLTFFSSIDTGNGHIHFTSSEGREEGCEVRIRHFQLYPQLIGNLLGQFHIHADDDFILLGGVNEFIGRIAGCSSYGKYPFLLDGIQKISLRLRCRGSSRLGCLSPAAACSQCNGPCCY